MICRTLRDSLILCAGLASIADAAAQPHPAQMEAPDGSVPNSVAMWCANWNGTIATASSCTFSITGSISGNSAAAQLGSTTPSYGSVDTFLNNGTVTAISNSQPFPVMIETLPSVTILSLPSVTQGAGLSSGGSYWLTQDVALEAGIGTPADTAWSGTGNSSSIAALKNIANTLSSTPSVKGTITAEPPALAGSWTTVNNTLTVANTVQQLSANTFNHSFALINQSPNSDPVCVGNSNSISISVSGSYCTGGAVYLTYGNSVNQVYASNSNVFYMVGPNVGDQITVTGN